MLRKLFNDWVSSIKNRWRLAIIRHQNSKILKGVSFDPESLSRRPKLTKNQRAEVTRISRNAMKKFRATHGDSPVRLN